MTENNTDGHRRFRHPDATQVLIVDDDPLVRAAVREALEADGDLAVCAEAGTGIEAIEAAREHSPDVVLMDVIMPELDGIAATRRIVENEPATRVVMLATVEDEELALLALRSGACGFLPKRTETAILPRILRRVVVGEAAISRALTAKLLERFRMLPELAPEGLRPVRSELTSREWEVLDLLCAAQSTESIAQELDMSVETVRSHVKRILRKLGVHSRAEAVEAAEQIRQEALHGKSGAPA